MACRKDPVYPVVPHIEYVGMEQTPVQGEGEGIGDIFKVTVRFEDGDGDMGLDSLDLRNPLYSQFNPDGTFNRYYYNYFITGFYKRDGIFEPITFPNPAFSLNGRYMKLTDDGRMEPLEGTLSYTFRLSPNNELQAGTVVKFQISIADRARNESNVVETEEVTLLFTK